MLALAAISSGNRSLRVSSTEFLSCLKAMSCVTNCSWNVSLLFACVRSYFRDFTRNIPTTRAEKECLPAVVTYSAEREVDIGLLDLWFRHGNSVSDVRRVLGRCVRQSSQSEGLQWKKRAGEVWN